MSSTSATSPSGPESPDLPEHLAHSDEVDVNVGFDFRSHPRLVYGANSVDRVGVFAKELTSSGRVLLVTDPGIEQAGHAKRVRDSLDAAGLSIEVFDGVIENPTTREVEHCVSIAREAEVDTIIGLGGGSAMDTAKGCNFILTNGGKMLDYKGRGLATKPMLPLIAIPTTAGTGSECQSFALIADEHTHMKMACGDPKAMAKVSILDPTLTVTQPARVTSDTGIDAVTHALETAVTSGRNALSLMYAHQSFKLTSVNLPRVLADPTDLEARGRMQLGAAFAGTAIENSMLGAAHAAANPLTAHYGVIHGQAVGAMMPAVIRFNAEDEAARLAYADLARHAGLAAPGDPAAEAVEALLARIESLLEIAAVPRSLHSRGVPKSEIPMLATEAAQQWTGKFNPRPVAEAEFEALYAAVWD